MAPNTIVRRALAKMPRPLARVLAMPYRFKIGCTYFREPIKHLALWTLWATEYTNFSYDLDDINERYLVAFVAHVTRRTYEEVESYVQEIVCDQELKRHIADLTQRSKLGAFADSNVKYGRRLAWYAIARAAKPKIVVEAGVDKGLGACVLTAALKRNSDEGNPGHYLGLDINTEAGYLLSGRYAEYGRLLQGDSVTELNKMNETIDLFISDSDHSASYEAKEYEAIRGKLADDAVVLGDNAHVTAELLNFARGTGRQFLFFGEKPYRHWYPGGGIGAAFGKTIDQNTRRTKREMLSQEPVA